MANPEFGGTIVLLGFGFLVWMGGLGTRPPKGGSIRLGTRPPIFTPLGHVAMVMAFLLIFVGRWSMGIEEGLQLVFLIVYPAVAGGWLFFFWARSRNFRAEEH